MRTRPLDPGTRLGYALAAAAAGHAALILGLGFETPRPESSPAMPALEVVLSTRGLEQVGKRQHERTGPGDHAGAVAGSVAR